MPVRVAASVDGLIREQPDSALTGSIIFPAMPFIDEVAVVTGGILVNQEPKTNPVSVDMPRARESRGRTVIAKASRRWRF